MLKDEGKLRQPVEEIVRGWKAAPSQAIENETNKIVRDYLGGAQLTLLGQVIRMRGGEFELR